MRPVIEPFTREELQTLIGRTDAYSHSGNPVWRHCYQELSFHLQVLDAFMELEQMRVERETRSGDED